VLLRELGTLFLTRALQRLVRPHAFDLESQVMA